MSEDKELDSGERVSWVSHGSRTTGRVRRKITRRTRAAGRTVDASPDRPQYEVESEKSGRTAVHRPESLRREGVRPDPPHRPRP